MESSLYSIKKIIHIHYDYKPKHLSGYEIKRIQSYLFYYCFALFYFSV